VPAPAPIGSDRLALRPLTVDDAGEMAAVLAGDDLYTFIGGTSPTEPELRARYQRWAAGRSPDGSQEWHNWVVRTKDDTEDGTAVGTVQATVTGEQADIAWVIGAAWQGRGYATEAATALVSWLGRNGIVRVDAYIHPDNAPSNAVARRLGLRATDDVEDGEVRWQRDLRPQTSAGD
jgi:RimJ/RimL family protein N-acetyltransferase